MVVSACQFIRHRGPNYLMKCQDVCKTCRNKPKETASDINISCIQCLLLIREIWHMKTLNSDMWWRHVEAHGWRGRHHPWRVISCIYVTWVSLQPHPFRNERQALSLSVHCHQSKYRTHFSYTIYHTISIKQAKWKNSLNLSLCRGNTVSWDLSLLNRQSGVTAVLPTSFLKSD